MYIGKARSLKGYIYILQSLLKDSFYIGSTNNLQKRIIEHQNGCVKSTKHIRPLELMFNKEFDTIQEAGKIEYKLKSYKSRKIIERIIEEKELKMGL